MYSNTPAVQPVYSNSAGVQPVYSNAEPEPLYCNLPDFVTALPAPPGYVTPPGPEGRLPPPYKTPSPSSGSQPLYVNMASLASHQPLYANLAKTLSTPSTPTGRSNDDGLFKVPLPPKHVSTSSCPASPSVTSSSSRPVNTSTSSSSSTVMPSSNLSLDSQFLDPDELAAKGATLLHHLALWMIQQKTTSEASGASSSSSQTGPESSSLVTEARAASPRLMAEASNTSTSPTCSSHLHTQSLPIRRQAVQSSSFSHLYTR